MLQQAQASPLTLPSMSTTPKNVLAPPAAAGRAVSTSAAAGSSSGSEARVYLITGRTDGIGKHTAMKLAHTGATVLVHGRNPQRVSDTVASIKRTTGNSSIHGYTADLSDLDSVRQLAAAVVGDHPRLHALVNNAGVYETKKRLSKDGYEMTWAVNVLAPFLLTSLLWKHVDAHIVTTASISAASSLDMANLQQEKGFSAHGAYSLSKLCDIIFTLQLHKWLQQQGSNIKVTTLDPGTVNTKMLVAGWGRIGMEVGEADNTFKLLTDPAVADLSGKYFVGHRLSRPPGVADDAKVQQQLWQLWTQQTGAEWEA